MKLNHRLKLTSMLLGIIMMLGGMLGAGFADIEVVNTPQGSLAEAYLEVSSEDDIDDEFLSLAPIICPSAPPANILPDSFSHCAYDQIVLFDHSSRGPPV